MAKSIFEQIKKQNGESFAKAIRAYDNGIFDIPNITEILKYAGSNAEPIMRYLVSLKNIQIEAQAVHKDPITLLNEAGYDAYYADTLEKQNAIKKYYAPGEELCTFRDPHRFQKYHIINAVRKDIDDIKREDFLGKEKREDKYGTSVLSIQILKTGGFISIKNRYNHKVENPDNTLDSNPDNIMRGLSDAIRHHLHVDFSSQKVALPENFIEIQGKIVHYDFEYNDIYFGDGFYVQNGEIHSVDKDKEILMDHFIFNTKTKTLTDLEDYGEAMTPDGLYHYPADPEDIDSLPDVLMKEIKGKKIQVTKEKTQDPKDRFYFIKADGQPIISVLNGRLNGLYLPTTEQISRRFGSGCRALKTFLAPALQIVGNRFLTSSPITDFDAPLLKQVGDSFLCENRLENLDFPLLEKAGNSFLSNSWKLSSLSLPRLQEVGSRFLTNPYSLTDLNAPALRTMGHYSLDDARKLQKLSLPSLQTVDDFVLDHAEKLTSIECPKLKSAGYAFLQCSKNLTSLSLPSLQTAKDGFLCNAHNLTSLDCPKLKTMGRDCLYDATSLTSLCLPALQEVGDQFLRSNTVLDTLDCPELKTVGGSFLERNMKLETLNLPSLTQAGDFFLLSNNSLLFINCPQLRGVGSNFLGSLGEQFLTGLCINTDEPKTDTKPSTPQKLTTLSLPQLRWAHEDFLGHNGDLEILDAPLLKETGPNCLGNNNSYKTNAPALKAKIPSERWLSMTDTLRLHERTEPIDVPSKKRPLTKNDPSR